MDRKLNPCFLSVGLNGVVRPVENIHITENMSLNSLSTGQAAHSRECLGYSWMKQLFGEAR